MRCNSELTQIDAREQRPRQHELAGRLIETGDIDGRDDGNGDCWVLHDVCQENASW